jgi:hypothetical protein
VSEVRTGAAMFALAQREVLPILRVAEFAHGQFGRIE